MTDLKPCPHCGGQANMYSFEVVTPMLNRRVPKKAVGCFSCEIFALSKYEDDAIEHWNRRAQQ